ncbi:MAG: cytidylate kinase family protein [Clostridia bacterium]|nr:cytidylate kinase family protein [Clostridia bacterium]
MQDKISLAGDLGSGKSTVSSILVKRIGAEYYSTGAIVRSIAEKHGMSVVELNVYMETHPEIDHEIDDGLKALSDVDKLLIIDSRMAWHFTSGTFKVYLSADPETTALRIMGANRVGEHASTLEETVKETRRRRDSERKRYMTQYGVDIKDLMNYSLIIDTSNATPDEVADRLIKSFYEWQENKDVKIAYLSPERIYYPDDAADMESASVLAAALDSGERIPEVTVTERDGEFYLVSGYESALAYGLNMHTFIPARLVRSDIQTENYVQMKNSL